jgi:hypothetical protein
MGDKGQKDKDRMRKQQVKDKAQKASDKKTKQSKQEPWPKGK